MLVAGGGERRVRRWVMRSPRVHGRLGGGRVSAASRVGASSVPECGPDVDGRTNGSARQVTHRKAFVDFQNDVTAADIALAEREGFARVEHLKRYTTLGMATDQGKTSNVNGLAVLAASTGGAMQVRVGTTTFRPPYTPVSIGALAGHHRGKEFRPTR